MFLAQVKGTVALFLLLLLVEHRQVAKKEVIICDHGPVNMHIAEMLALIRFVAVISLEYGKARIKGGDHR